MTVVSCDKVNGIRRGAIEAEVLHAWLTAKSHVTQNELLKSAQKQVFQLLMCRNRLAVSV